jgi:hypothetical protein
MKILKDLEGPHAGRGTFRREAGSVTVLLLLLLGQRA